MTTNDSDTMIILDLDNVILPRVNDRYNKNFSLKASYREGKENLKREILNRCGNIKCFKAPHYVDIEVGTHLDIDSCIKPLIDSIQESGLIENDKNILYLNVVKRPLKRNEKNWIKVKLGEL